MVHSLFYLNDSFDNEIFVHKEDIPETSLTSSFQLFYVFFFHDIATADFYDQWVQIFILQALSCNFIESFIKLEEAELIF
jgi:hypothetical protein